MEHYRKSPLAMISVIVILAALVGGVFIGETMSAVTHQEEKDYIIKLNRSELEGLGDIDETIYVTGHKSPDSDTVGSSIAFADLLRQLGYDAQPVVLGKLNNETKFILKAAGLDEPMLMEDAAGYNMALVDHSEYTHSSDGLKDAHIVCIIDHHGDGAVTTGNQLIYDARPLGSTATIIWMRYRNYGLEPDKATALVMLGSILSDTKDLMSGTTTFADREAVKDLTSKAGIMDVDAFYQSMNEAAMSYEGMTDEEIFFSDYKEYECAGNKYSIGCINAVDEKEALDFVDRMKKIIPSLTQANGLVMAYAQISIFHDGISITYIVPSNPAAASVIEAGFGDDAVFDGNAYRLEPGISRKQVLVPVITDILESYPKE